jgi:hypothetical protein
LIRSKESDAFALSRDPLLDSTESDDGDLVLFSHLVLFLFLLPLWRWWWRRAITETDSHDSKKAVFIGVPFTPVRSVTPKTVILSGLLWNKGMILPQFQGVLTVFQIVTKCFVGTVHSQCADKSKSRPCFSVSFFGFFFSFFFCSLFEKSENRGELRLADLESFLWHKELSSG